MRVIKEILLIISGALQDAWADIWTVLVCNLVWTVSVILVMLGRNPGFSLILSVLLVLLLAAGLALFMLTLVCGGVVVASAGNRAVINRLDAHRQTPT